MSWTNKVVWHEGMLLRPQHFQQQDRYVEALVRGRAAGLRPYAWGLREWRLDTGLLENGQVGLAFVTGVLPDGTPVAAPGPADLPRPIDIPEGTRDTVVYLALPLSMEAAAEAGSDAAEAARLTMITVDEVVDSAASGAAPAELALARLRLSLQLGDRGAAGYTRMGVARILEVRPDRSVRLDDSYIPPCLDSRGAPALANILEELRGRFRQLAQTLAGRIAQPADAAVSNVRDLLMLQVANRTAPLLDHQAGIADLHPEALYAVLVASAGELSTFAARDRRPPVFLPYRHEALRESFAPVVTMLRQYLAFRPPDSIVSVPLEDRGYGVHIARLEDLSLLVTASFVLAVTAEMDVEELRRRFRAQTKAAPMERLREIHGALVAGFELRPLPVAPEQLPRSAETVYFSIDKSGPLWREIKAGFGFHVAGQFPGLTMRFWAILGASR